MIPRYSSAALAETASPLMAASLLVGAAVRAEEPVRRVSLAAPPAASASLAAKRDAKPEAELTAIDEIAPTLRKATVEDLCRRHPQALCWWGEKTRQWWAYLVLGADRMLISADSPYRLSDRITEMTMTTRRAA
ncbi:hypothetical protein BJF79_21700 [Actinomadura sp. CNU-125]|uniref:hypothetical protein n=1 Tax=Actinomadura sp. CNU-125 TaxID=1904961 RepID=UPI0009634AF5|nr:hypothetical protein [Actinomadura sp. CNU-125]OLT12716.1 hypothetical protein BJF79_21700 [Actinomadura sp. CNU-125]